MIPETEQPALARAMAWKGKGDAILDPKLFFSRYNDTSEADLARVNHLSLLSCNPSGSTAFLWPRSWEHHFDSVAASSGLLGIQAPAAEEPLFHVDSNPLLPPSFFKAPPSLPPRSPTFRTAKTRSRKASVAKPLRSRKVSSAVVTLKQPPSRPAKKVIPYIPNEIHLEIIGHLLSSSSPSSACGICDLAELSKLARVSRFHNALITPKLYSTLALDLHTTPSASCCHARTTKTSQLERRLPLLLRTLSYPRCPAVTKLQLPANIKNWLSCALEKDLLPRLLSLCPELQEVTGLEGLLERQFFAGEHYCLTEPQQHGMLPEGVMGLTSLRRWKWVGGDVTTGDKFWTRVFDQRPNMMVLNWSGMHYNWQSLQELTLQGLTGVTSFAVAELFSHLPAVSTLRVEGIGRRVRGRLVVGCDSMMQVLSEVPVRVSALEIAGVPDDTTFLVELGRWIATCAEKGRMLERLKVEKVATTCEGMREFLKSLAVKEEGGRWGMNRWKSSVQRLEIVEPRTLAPLEDVFNWDPEWRDLRGLNELVWEEDAKELENALLRGWFADVVNVDGWCEAASDSLMRVLAKRGQRWLRLVE